MSKRRERMLAVLHPSYRLGSDTSMEEFVVSRADEVVRDLRVPSIRYGFLLPISAIGHPMDEALVHMKP